MKTLIIVSYCLKALKNKTHPLTYEFHFKGVCSGEVLKKILLESDSDLDIRPRDEYLLYVEVKHCSAGVLEGKILRAKPLKDCWDCS
jgi:hypothetical protein